MLKILAAPDKILDSPVKKVQAFDARLAKLVREMEKTLIAQKDPQGVGLAAPQVGHQISLFIMKPTPKAKTEVFVNPRIVKNLNTSGDFQRVTRGQGPDSVESTEGAANPDGKSRAAGPVVENNEHSPPQRSKSKQKSSLEGCLSIPRVWGQVHRTQEIEIEYQTLDGAKKKEVFTKFKAIIIQHELDHLAGVLFTRRVLEQQNPLYEEIDGKLKRMKY